MNTEKSLWRFFDFLKWRRPPCWFFWNYKVLTEGRIISVELRHHAKFRGDWSNRCHDISILDFSRCWQPQAWIFKILHFNDLNSQEGRTASLCQILSKSLKPRRRYVSFRFFKMAIEFSRSDISQFCMLDLYCGSLFLGLQLLLTPEKNN